MIIANIVVAIFSVLCAGAYGKDGSIKGTLAALTVFRFCLGVGLGGVSFIFF